ncbi:plasmid replication, integration and excision activator, partial [Protofrankia coriariae]
MAVPQRIPVAFTDVFPHGAYVLGVEPVNDFDKAKAG